MCFIKYDGNGLVAFVGFDGERVGGLGDERRFVEPGCPPERCHDRGVEPSGSDSGVGEVDDPMPGRVKGAGRGADREGFAGADLTGDNPDRCFVDGPADPGDCLVVGLVVMDHPGGDVLPEWHAGEPVVGAERVDTHGRLSSSMVVLSGSVLLVVGLVGIWYWPGIWSGSVVSMRAW